MKRKLIDAPQAWFEAVYLSIGKEPVKVSDSNGVVEK